MTAVFQQFRLLLVIHREVVIESYLTSGLQTQPKQTSFHLIMIRIFIAILLTCFTVLASSLTPAELDKLFSQMLTDRQLMGMSVEISNNSQTIYKGNFGLRDYDRKLPVDNNTIFRMASLSKSITASGLMLLVEQGKLQLTDNIADLLGFKAVNPNFPTIPITVEMVLSHQSSLIECSAYDNFLTDTYNAVDGSSVPLLSTLFTQGSKYFNSCTFSTTHAPGTYYQYVNLNYVIAGTIIQRLSGVRFDIYMADKFLSKVSGKMNFNPAQLSNKDDLAVLYIGSSGKWAADCDNYKGVIPQRNLTGYVVGTNAAIYGPQGSVRASVSDLTKYINLLRLRGFNNETKTQVLAQTSVAALIRPKYQFHGTAHGSANDFHAYGAGIFTTTYRTNDNIWPHKVVVGHTGSAYGLISAYFYNTNFTVAYAVSGALNGYKYSSNTFFEVERQLIHNYTHEFVFGTVGEIQK